MRSKDTEIVLVAGQVLRMELVKELVDDEIEETLLEIS